MESSDDMNKLFVSKLAEQAGLVDYGVNFGEPVTPAELFAALIAKECIMILMDGDFWNGAPLTSFQDAAKRAEAIHAAFCLPGNGKYVAEFPRRKRTKR